MNISVKIEVNEYNSYREAALALREFSYALEEDGVKAKSAQRARHDFDSGNAIGQMRISKRFPIIK